MTTPLPKKQRTPEQEKIMGSTTYSAATATTQ
ncbi:hypothetical protein ABIB45_003866 [Arthrobacter sp. UYCo732]